MIQYAYKTNHWYIFAIFVQICKYENNFICYVWQVGRQRIKINWLCFSVIFRYVQWNIIHLFPLHKGDMKICLPEKYDYFEGEQMFMSPLCKGNECFIPPGQRFGEFCQMKSFGHLCLQNYYFGTSLKLYMTKALNLENFE